MTESSTKPFKGILYNPAKIGDIAACVCPPYDVISSADAYYARNPYNAVRLELPAAEPPLEKYGVAKQTMDQWLKDGILQKDADDTVYVYEQEFTINEMQYLRRGFIALNRLQKERILTHEETRKKAKEDREKLISTLRTFTSLVFALYEDKENVIEDLLADSQKQKIYDFVDEQSITNRFYRMTDQGEIGRLASLMEEKSIYVADGHHRLAVSYRLGLKYIPLYLTNMYSTGIAIFPYHRNIKLSTPRSLTELLALLDERVEIERIPLTGNNSPKEAVEGIRKASKPSYVMYSRNDPDHLYLLREKHPVYADPTVHESTRKLKVSILHTGILKNILNIQDGRFLSRRTSTNRFPALRTEPSTLPFFFPPPLWKRLRK